MGMLWPRERNWHTTSLSFLTGQWGGATRISQQSNKCTGVTAQPCLPRPGPLSPHIPSSGLAALPLSRLPPHLRSPVTVLPVSSNRRSLPMAALRPEPRLPSMFSMKCFIGINQSTQIKKSRRWEIPRLRNKGKHLLKCCLFFKLQFKS